MAITVEQKGEFIRVNETRIRLRDLVNYAGVDNESYGGRGRYILKIIYKATGNETFQLKIETESKEDLTKALEAIDEIMFKVAQPNPQE